MPIFDGVPTLDNVMFWYDQATPEQIYKGEIFYEQAHEQLLQALPQLPVAYAAGGAAVLSPQLQWEDNIRQAVRLYELGGSGVYRAYGRIDKPRSCVGKAYRIMIEGEHPLSVIPPKAQKTFAFYHNLMLDPGWITCDRHTISAALSEEYIEPALVQGWGKRKRYLVIENIFRAGAAYTSRVSYKFQAIVWIVIREFFAKKLKLQGVYLSGT